MKLRLFSFLGLFCLVLLLGACDTGGSGSGVAGVSGNCPGAPEGSFCLVSCSLGCSNGGCGISEIAVNQSLVMVFNRTVDPATVNSATFSLRTSTGKRPAGKVAVVMDGQGQPTNTVTFTPEVVVSGSQTSFGFDSGATYLLYLPARDQAAETIRSTNGFPLYGGLLCTLNASKGVVDPDGKAPQATLVSPLNGATNVPQDVAIEIGFSELLNMSTVENPSSVDVYVSMSGGVPTLVQCARYVTTDPDPRNPTPVTLTLKPSILLPSNSDVEVRVKGEIRDLAGKPCVPQNFKFTITNTGSSEVKLEEVFQDTTMFDSQASSGSWGAGKVTPGLIGGSGVLGPFDKNMFVNAKPVGNTLTINTDYMKVAAENTLTELEIEVTDGIFEFETFIVPTGLVINFVGSNVPKIFSRGEVVINGTLKVNGLSAPSHDGSSLLAGPGGRSNCGGGVGGLGCIKKGAGRNGSPVAFPKGSARYNSAAAIAAGGKGSPAFPASSSLITFNGYDGWVCAQLAAGGSGGSNATAGLKGVSKLTGTDPKLSTYRLTDEAPDNLPGTPFDYSTKLGNEASTLQFLAGGSGGGGGGSNPVGSMKGYTEEWHSGQGGGAGGGALLIRAGGNLGIATGGILESRGGNSPSPIGYKRAVPGGGGSGGNILLQAGGTFLSQGVVRAPGGLGGQYSELASYNWNTESRGGDGGKGYLRVETLPAPMPNQLVGFDPAPSASNVGLLEDRDPVTGVRSRFYQTKRLMPFFNHFVIEAVVNGTPVTYSDDSRLGTLCVFDPGKGTAVSIFLQGGQVDSLGQPIGSTLTKWVTTAGGLNELKNWFGGKASARPTSARWVLIFDKSVLTGPATIEIKKVTIFCQG